MKKFFLTATAVFGIIGSINSAELGMDFECATSYQSMISVSITAEGELVEVHSWAEVTVCDGLVTEITSGSSILPRIE